MPRVRVAVAILLGVLSLAFAAYGLLYIGAIWTSDTSDGSLIKIASVLLGLAAVLMTAAVRVFRGRRRPARYFAKPS